MKPPVSPRGPTGTTINPRYGVPFRLPDDYLDFLAIYGAGYTSPDPVWRIKDLTNDAEFTRTMQTLGATVDRSLEYDGYVWFAYPYGGDLIPFGGNDQGTIFYWLVDGHPNDWAVAFGRFELINTHMPFSKFLYESITGVAAYEGSAMKPWQLPITYHTFAEFDRAKAEADADSTGR